MKIEETKPIEPVPPVGRKSQSVAASDRDSSSFGNTIGYSDSDDVREEAIDVESFHGLSEEDLTPTVRTAMLELITEIGQLRQELSISRKRVAYLSNLADHDDLSTVLNRRAFLRELSHAQILAREYGAANTLVFINIENLKSCNDQFGHAFGDAMVEFAGELLLGFLEKADVVGRLGGAEFAVVLVGTAGVSAMAKAEELRELLSNRPLIQTDVQVTLEVSIGVHPLARDEDVESALATIDRDQHVLDQDQ